MWRPPGLRDWGTLLTRPRAEVEAEVDGVPRPVLVLVKVMVGVGVGVVGVWPGLPALPGLRERRIFRGSENLKEERGRGRGRGQGTGRGSGSTTNRETNPRTD